MTVYTVISTVLWQGVLLFCIIIMINTHRHVEHIIHRQAYKDDKKLLMLPLWKLNIFQGDGKDKCKQHCKPNIHGCNHSQKIMSETKILSHKIIHCHAYVKHVFSISILWCEQSIQGLSYWACPVEPSPPYRNSLFLMIQKKR